jgi:hypothetical protein
MATVAVPSPLDATDIVDACDRVDALPSNALSDTNDQGNEKKDDEADEDFNAFSSAKTLQKETLAEAQVLAQEQKYISNNNSNENSIENGAENAAKNADGVETVLVSENNKDVNTRNPRFVSAVDFELLKVIGMGAFGKVLQVKNKTSDQILAMKVISKRLLRRKAGYIENIQAERNILTRVSHPFVVKMHCSFQTKEKLFIIMDFLAGGELFLRLGREGIFLEKDAAFYLAEIILGVDHLHSLGILHRDLKPENILLCNDGHICLTDFGLAKDFGPNWNDQDEGNERARTICGTLEYMAPGTFSRSLKKVSRTN